MVKLREILRTLRKYVVLFRIGRYGQLPTKRAQCAAMLTMLRPERFAHYSPKVGANFEIATGYLSIEHLTKTLRHLNVTIGRLATLKDYSLEQEVAWTTLDTFFISRSGHYLNIVDAVAELKKELTTFCALMEPTDPSPDTGMYGYYKRSLESFTEMLLVVLQALLVASV